ncbi:hypothetical protein FD754_021702 [Muntiacus muntjak]|uniref:Mos1 transposase HTH domain-containing protein n=1 Tax=Muntiacus muntjak TaxID=9888 RepID=A0A5N3V6F2_MUNMU|nr:hypothetical protein FD754_021702 [Muntiacus muntjak]
MELMLDKKQIQTIFLFKFKMDRKAAETPCNINNALGPGTANEHTVEWWFKKFCKGDECLEDEERKVTEELSVNHPVVVQHLKQIGKMKKLNKWVPCELTKNKNCHFEVLSSLILCNNKSFLYWTMMCNKRWILFDKHW